MRFHHRLASYSTIIVAAVWIAEASAAAPQPSGTRTSTSPSLRKAIDVPIPHVDQVAWSPNGKTIAIRAVEMTDAQTAPQGVQAVATFKRNVIVVIPDVTAANPQFLTITLPRAAKLVGFTPDGKYLVTDLREYNLVSGFHRLSFWEEQTAPAVPASAGESAKAQMALVRTIDLDSDQTYGYAFSPDGKTFRTVYREETAANPRLIRQTNLEVREMSAATGETLRTLFKVDGTYKTHAVSADGGRLAAVDAATDKLSVWDVARGEKISAYDLPADKEEDEPAPIGPFGGRAELQTEQPINLLFSQDGRRVVCFRAPRVNVVLNADKGEPLPALEQAERTIATGGFAANGRLLVASGSQLIETRRTIGKQPGNLAAKAGGFGGPGQGGGAGGFNGPGGMPQTVRSYSYSNFVGVWDATTGKRLRGWDRSAVVASNPSRPMIAILESNGDGGVRLGIWDVPVNTAEKR